MERTNFTKMIFLTAVMDYSYDYFKRYARENNIPIDKVYEIVIDINFIKRRNEFYELFASEQVADTLWTRFIDHYICDTPTRNMICEERKKYEKNKI